MLFEGVKDWTYSIEVESKVKPNKFNEICKLVTYVSQKVSKNERCRTCICFKIIVEIFKINKFQFPYAGCSPLEILSI